MSDVFLDPKLVGKEISIFRKERGLSQEVVSGLANIGRTHLSAIERGERKPTLETFYRLCIAMKVKPSLVMKSIEEAVSLEEQENTCSGSATSFISTK